MNPKRAEFERLLALGVVQVHFDPRREDVHAPARLRSQPWLKLNFSMRYGLRDFQITDDDVSATLSFGGQPYFCRVPWRTVFAITDIAREGMAWPEDVPPEVAILSTSMDPPAPPPVVLGGGQRTDPKRGHLRVIRSGEGDPT